MPKLTFDDVMELLSEDRRVDQSQVPDRVQRRKVWIASNGLVGCMNDSHNVCTRKRDAIDTCVQIADSGEGPPRGIVRALRSRGDARFSEDGYYVYRVERVTLAELL